LLLFNEGDSIRIRYSLGLQKDLFLAIGGKRMKNIFITLKQTLKQPSIALDLGTGNTRIFSSESGQITEKPSSIRRTDSTTFVADEYLSYLNSKVVFAPLQGGVIVDVQNATNLLRPLLKKTIRSLRHPVSLTSAPTNTSDQERELLAKAVLDAGASHVAIIPEAWAAAIGAGMDVTLPTAQALIDIGDGVTDMVVIRDGRIIYATAVRTACSDLQKAVRSKIVAKHKVCIDPPEAERLTHKISSMSQGRPFLPDTITASGMNIFTGRKVTINVNEHDIIIAMEPVIHKMLKNIELGLGKIPEPVFNEVLESGICLTGGGACISGIDTLIASKTRLDVRIAPDPMHAVINGEIATLTHWKAHKDWWKNIVWPKLAS